MPPFKRKRFFVSSFQYHLLACNLVYFVAILVIFAAAAFLPLMLQLEDGTLPLAERNRAATQLLSLHERVWLPILLALVLVMLHSISLSHRIAGPLYRFMRVYEDLAAGNLSVKAIIRKKDFLAREADGLNAMIENLGARIARANHDYRNARAALIALESVTGNGSVEELEKGIEKVAEQIRELEASLGQFKTASGRDVPQIEDDKSKTAGSPPSQPVTVG